MTLTCYSGGETIHFGSKNADAVAYIEGAWEDWRADGGSYGWGVEWEITGGYGPHEDDNQVEYDY